MNKKSFLRGFGIGVLFAAVILGISFTVRTSDSYVVSKAKELGMVYKSEQDSVMACELPVILRFRVFSFLQC